MNKGGRGQAAQHDGADGRGVGQNHLRYLFFLVVLRPQDVAGLYPRWEPTEHELNRPSRQTVVSGIEGWLGE
jgi:hypothetical protein